MDAAAPTFVDIPVFCAPKKAPCPHCGKKARRIKTHERRVRTIAYHQIAFLKITVGEYQACCGCCATFRTTPDEVLPRHKYDNKVRAAVLERILDDRMNVEATRHSLARDFLLNLSTGFVYDCLRDTAAQLDLAAHRTKILEVFSGVLCIDELHLGQFSLLLATDPLRDIPVAFALVDKNDQDHMGRFLKNLKRHGFEPKVIITDGSSLYPTLVQALWPQAEHQLCVFHVIQDVNKEVLKVVLRLRRALSRRGNRGRKRRRGRPTKAQKRRRRQDKKSQKEQAQFIFKRRYLIVKKRERLTEQDKKDLKTMLGYVPELRVLRAFADALQRLFAAEQTEDQAWGRWQRLQRHAQYLAVPELQAVLETMLSREKFTKMIAFLRCPKTRRVRTNNHVERCNRQLRFLEKVRYKWRRRRTLVRFLVLTLDHWWKQALPALLAERAAAKAKRAQAKRKQPRSSSTRRQAEPNSQEGSMPTKRRKTA